MEVNNVSLEAVGVKLEQFPATGLPEIAFVGRSNVGKSSLINSMINRKALARTSQNPGKTRTINFYNVESLLYFVDLPGYGYAKISRSESEKWGKMIEGYLKKREQLKAVVLLVDIRHTPSVLDIQMFEWLSYYGKRIIIAATKADKLNRSQLQKSVKAIRDELGASEVIPYSSESKLGKQELWEIIEGLCVPRDSENDILSDK